MAIARRQAARYGKSQKLASATLALFVPVSDEEVLRKLCGEELIDGCGVITVAIGWTWTCTEPGACVAHVMYA